MSTIGKFWMFTENNFKSIEKAWPPSVVYACWQHECGAKTGTNHLQGYVEFSRNQRRSACVKMFQADWRVRLGTQEQATAYVTKQDSTYVAGPWEYGVKTVSTQGARTDLEQACAIVKAGGMKALADAMPQEFVKYERGLKAYAFIQSPTRDWIMDVRVYWGAAGTGKTRSVYDEFGADSIYVKDPTTQWWDGYNGEQCVLIDEFYGTLPFSYMQRLLDRYKFPVQIKGGADQFRSKVIIITCNVPWTTWYQAKFEAYPEVMASFKRRLSVVRQFMPDGTVVDVTVDVVVPSPLDDGI